MGGMPTIETMRRGWGPRCIMLGVMGTLIIAGLLDAYNRPARAGTVCALAWDRPTTYADGTPIPVSEALKYRVYAARTSSGYTVGQFQKETDATTIPCGDVITSAGEWFLVVTAKDTATGLESARSNEPPFDSGPVNAPGNLRRQ